MHRADEVLAPPNVFRALQAGASGFVLKDIPAEELAAAVRVLARGEALLAPSVTKHLIEELALAALRRRDDDVDLSALTEREGEILTLVERGRSNAEIADALVIGTATVKSHVSKLLGKLGVRDRVQGSAPRSSASASWVPETALPTIAGAASSHGTAGCGGSKLHPPRIQMLPTRWE